MVEELCYACPNCQRDTCLEFIPMLEGEVYAQCPAAMGGTWNWHNHRQ